MSMADVSPYFMHLTAHADRAYALRFDTDGMRFVGLGS